MSSSSSAPAPAPAAGLQARELTGPVVAAMLVLYFVWGSTYLAIRVALDGFPPLLMAGLRYTLAGLGLLALHAATGGARPRLQHLRGAALIGLLLCSANALVVVSEQWVSTGLTAVVVCSVPLWVALMSGFFGEWPNRRDWLGLGVGLSGVIVLNLGGDLRGQPLGAFLLLFSALSWSLGSTLSRRIEQPTGMLGSGVQMLCGGLAVGLVGLLRGERLVALPGHRPLLAFAYLVVFGSMVSYSAFVYVLARTRPVLATSYAYVNPVVAVGLGVLFLGETVSPLALLALVLVLGGVGLVAFGKK
jgi:drug/metabolite transporter (DMT)-like permease